MKPLYIYIEDQKTREVATYTFTSSPIRVGRNPMNDLQLDFPFVSQWHSIIRFDAEHVHYIDLGSTNGSKADGTQVPKNQLTAVGEHSRLGIVSLNITVSRVPREHGPSVQSNTHIGPVPTGRVSHIYPGESSELPPYSPAHLSTQQRVMVDDSLMSLQERYDAYRLAWHELHQDFSVLLDQFEGSDKALAFERVQEMYPKLVHETKFQSLARKVGVDLGQLPSSSGSLSRLAEAFLPSHRSLTKAADEERFAERMAAVLEGFGTALIELLKGYQEFQEQTGIRTMVSPTGLLRSTESREVLAYLLDWGHGADDRLQELISAFADLMIHQVAMVSGMVDGARGLLGDISPMVIVAHSNASGGLLGKIWPFRGNKYWKLFCKQHELLFQDDSLITRSLFGRDFARAYATVIGQQAQFDGTTTTTK